MVSVLVCAKGDLLHSTLYLYIFSIIILHSTYYKHIHFITDPTMNHPILCLLPVPAKVDFPLRLLRAGSCLGYARLFSGSILVDTTITSLPYLR